jgi:hypothetical protein
MVQFSLREGAAKLLLVSVVMGCPIDDRDVAPAPTTSAPASADGGTRPPLSPSDGFGDPRGAGEPGFELDLDGEGNGLSADAGGGAAMLGASCAPGEAACVSTTERIECDANGVWTAPSPCQNACLDGACGGACVPGSSECVSSTGLRRCSASGEWEPESSCDNACFEGNCAGECRPGASRCATGTSAQICDDAGSWAAAVECQNACVGSACAGECPPGSTRCFDSRDVQICNADGQWQLPERCTNACTGGACGGECVPGSQRCNSASGAPQVCSDEGVWQNRSACDFVCQNGACGGECLPGARRCNPQSGIPQLCSVAGVWQNQASCAFTCSGAGLCTGACRAPDARCVGARLEVCENFQFQLADTCLSADLCDAAAAVCLENPCADDNDPNSTVESHPVHGCGLRWNLPNDSSGDWIEFDSGLQVDLETGAGWMAPGGSLTRDELAAACNSLTVNGVGGWTVPTINQVRALAAGCAATAPGGSCGLSDPSCLSQSCGSCASCLGGNGPAAGLYCRPNVRICFGLRTRSACSDCDEPSDWSYGVSNGNFLARTATTRFASFCVRPGFPL